jgi:tRNA-Thr(GGU) m(6)t(6)A37 methyltransferase TsaA
MKMDLWPIGTVTRQTQDGAEVEINPRFSAGLNGIEKNKYIWVLFWMHKLTEADRNILEAHPMGDRKKAKRGVFALRSPMRPNPIGLTRGRVVERNGNTLIVAGLDAFEGTPVIDIKPAFSIEKNQQ